MGLLQSLFGRSRHAPARSSRNHVSAASWPDAIYAVGDIHGCAKELDALHALIMDDAKQFAGEKWLVYLGDYVDRGPNSAGVLDRIIAPAPSGFQRIPLVGNHESMMLDFIASPGKDHDWLRHGGAETLASYGVYARDLFSRPARMQLAQLYACIPDEHLSFLRDLPLTASVPGTTFVHAGLRPGIALKDQTENDLLWIREAFLDEPVDHGQLIVHGHTPAPEPVLAAGRIGIDTGAFATGILTAVRLTEQSQPHFLSATVNLAR